MFLTIDKRKTGINIRRIMDERGFTVKDVQVYLGLGSVQSVYHWLSGISMPTIDNLYALSELFQISIDEMLCGNKQQFVTHAKKAQYERLRAYCERIDRLLAA